jgi:hypothetical protein
MGSTFCRALVRAADHCQGSAQGGAAERENLGRGQQNN